MLLFTSLVYPGVRAERATPGFEYDADCNKTKSRPGSGRARCTREFTRTCFTGTGPSTGSAGAVTADSALNGGTPAASPKDLTPGDPTFRLFHWGVRKPTRFRRTARKSLTSQTPIPTWPPALIPIFSPFPCHGGEAKRITNNPAAERACCIRPMANTSPTVRKFVRDMRATYGVWLYWSGRQGS